MSWMVELCIPGSVPLILKEIEKVDIHESGGLILNGHLAGDKSQFVKGSIIAHSEVAILNPPAVKSLEILVTPGGEQVEIHVVFFGVLGGSDVIFAGGKKVTFKTKAVYIHHGVACFYDIERKQSIMVTDQYQILTVDKDEEAEKQKRERELHPIEHALIDAFSNKKVPDSKVGSAV